MKATIDRNITPDVAEKQLSGVLTAIRENHGPKPTVFTTDALYGTGREYMWKVPHEHRDEVVRRRLAAGFTHGEVEQVGAIVPN